MNIKIIGFFVALVFAVFSGYSFAEEESDNTELEEVAEEVFIEPESIEYDFEFDVMNDDENMEIDEVRTVSVRMTCKEINERVKELREDVKAYPELKSELETMLSRQRTQCAARANRRPVHNYENVNPVMVVDVPVVEEETDVVAEPVVIEEKPAEPVKTPEEIAAEQAEQERKIAENIANGLCDDGTKPNRYGCCEGEKFKEVSQMNFACCPKEGEGECHEPRKKK
ncbi:MAG: hypothetical protein J5742_02075 [Alphaproteobacteria bacterium]|nr:hypothetical protein [Alphaproteobacteria bacterium]